MPVAIWNLQFSIVVGCSVRFQIGPLRPALGIDSGAGAPHSKVVDRSALRRLTAERSATFDCGQQAALECFVAAMLSLPNQW
jgi:hypothetical protein